MQDNTKNFKPEIQGLRAIAVAIVIIFHVWPEHLSGGYIGVDVFFVISGYLITGLLLREAEKAGSISLTNFYMRRVRRLMPAASAVFLTVALLHDFLPAVLWETTTKEIIASALYFQNWFLASEAVDYLAATNSPSPLQHYWSLSVEEQYYIVWPLLFIFGLLLSRQSSLAPKKVVAILVGFVGITSLLYSIYLTDTNQGLAYFSTATRAWEMSLGGLLAVSNRWTLLSEQIKKYLGFVGVGMILYSSIFFTKLTPFPGSAALIPTLGTVFVILAGNSETKIAAATLLKTPVFQYLGNISYSLYLWHWPIIILYGAIKGTSFNIYDGIVIIALSICLADISKRYIEDPFIKRYSLTNRATLLLGGSLIIVSGFSAYLIYSSNTLNNHDDKKVIRIQTSLQQASIKAKNDIPEVYEKGCHVDQSSSEAKHCLFGSDESSIKIALVGDSHAAQWVPSLSTLAIKNNWTLYSFTKSACAIADVTIRKEQAGGAYISCDQWRDNVILELKRMNPDLVVISQSSHYVVYDDNAKILKYIRRLFGSFTDDNNKDTLQLADGLLRFKNQLSELNMGLLAINDTPFLNIDVPTCLSTKDINPIECDSNSDNILNYLDPIKLAATKDPSFLNINMNDYLCSDGTCPAIINDIIVWRDNNHITASFSRSLSELLEIKITEKVPLQK